ncbi:MAG TPA: hypothetical protein DEF82_05105 [Crocinitomicaceae bacterium]|nr:hypothetical protein [Flavobacteriales bacterium]HBW86122.1 hypothetical protein [Crocinitomicaceae bacterium]
MINKPILILFAFVFCNNLNAQSSASIRRKDIRKVEQKQIDYKDGKEIISKWSLDEYDKWGRVISEKQFNSDSTYKVFETFQYDRKGRVLSQCEFDKFGKLKKKTDIEYDNMNDRKEERVYSSNNELIEVIRFKYNAFGFKTEEITFKPDGLTILKKIIYSHDSKGSIIERKVFDDKGKLIQARNYLISYN